MSSLVKAEVAHSVRPFFQAVVSCRLGESEIHEPACLAEDPQLAPLRDKIVRLEAALEQSATILHSAKLEAKKAGREEVQETIRRDETKQLQALNDALSVALEAWDSRLAELDGLAALLSKAALSKLFDDSACRSELVLGTIARQMRHLRREAVVAVRVSDRDFADETALQAVAAQASVGSITVIADPDLEGGDCRLDLQLGHLDIGPRAQWAQLAALLDEFVAEDGVA